MAESVHDDIPPKPIIGPVCLRYALDEETKLEQGILSEEDETLVALELGRAMQRTLRVKNTAISYLVCQAEACQAACGVSDDSHGIRTVYPIQYSNGTVHRLDDCLFEGPPTPVSAA